MNALEEPEAPRPGSTPAIGLEPEPAAPAARASPPRLPRFELFSLRKPLPGRSLKQPSARRHARKPPHPYRSVPASDGPDTYQTPAAPAARPLLLARRGRSSSFAPPAARLAAPAVVRADSAPPVVLAPAPAPPAVLAPPMPLLQQPLPPQPQQPLAVPAALQALAVQQPLRASPVPLQLPLQLPFQMPYAFAAAALALQRCGGASPSPIQSPLTTTPASPAPARAQSPATPAAPVVAAATPAAATYSGGSFVLPPKNSGTSDYNWLGQRKSCGSCGVTKTPYWRDGRDNACLCNACGIRFKKHRVACRGCQYVPRKRESSTGVCPRCSTSLADATS